MPVSMKNVLRATVKMINLTRSLPLYACLFNIPCGEMGKAQKAILLTAQVHQQSRREAVV